MERVNGKQKCAELHRLQAVSTHYPRIPSGPSVCVCVCACVYARAIASVCFRHYATEHNIHTHQKNTVTIHNTYVLLAGYDSMATLYLSFCAMLAQDTHTHTRIRNLAITFRFRFANTTKTRAGWSTTRNADCGIVLCHNLTAT